MHSPGTRKRYATHAIAAVAACFAAIFEEAPRGLLEGHSPTVAPAWSTSGTGDHLVGDSLFVEKLGGTRNRNTHVSAVLCDLMINGRPSTGDCSG